MTNPVNSNTFLGTYNDDYRDSDHFHRILFNSGRALQARELTQSQTIIQKEIERIARFLFKEGSIFNTSYGALNSGVDAVDYVKVQSLPDGYELLVGTEITNPLGLTAVVKAVIPAEGSDPAALFIKYTGGNNLVPSAAKSPRRFLRNEVLTTDLGAITTQSTNTSSNPVTGKGAFAEVPRFNTFAGGHMLFVEAQTLVISKFDAYPTAVVGFKLVQEIVTATDNVALYDNSGATPNLTSPGADRLKISMILMKQEDLETGDSFFPVYNIIRGEVRVLQSRDNVLNEMGKILNSRTHHINGDFVVNTDRPRYQFGMIVQEDSDEDYLNYVIDPGIAFVGGQKIEINDHTKHRVYKPRSLTKAIETVNNVFVDARYGNYFVANEDSALGLVDAITNYTTVNLRSAANYGGSTIGTARIRHIDKYEDIFKYHVFDLKMDSVAGSPYSLGLIRSIGTGGTAYANLTPIEGRYDLYDREDNSLLFPFPRDRINEMETVTMPVRGIFTATVDVNGHATFNTGSSSKPFTDYENWILQVNSTGELITTLSFVGTPANGQAVINTGLTNGTAVTLLAIYSISATRKTKTLITGQTAVVSVTNREFQLSHVDLYQVVSIVDDTSGENITSNFFIDNGQRDNYYTVASGRLKPGIAAPAGTITVSYSYFQHGSGDFFGGKASYADVDYENVPEYTTDAGKTYRLTDVIDMRPRKNNTGSGFTGTGAVKGDIPKNAATITIGQVKYWRERTDLVTLDPTGHVTIRQGRAGGGEPTIPRNALALHKIDLKPYTLDNRDLSISTYPNKGYKMKHIRELEDRLANIEVATTLNSAEIRQLQTSIPDPYDATLPDRVKLGLTAEDFGDNLQSAVRYPDYRAKRVKRDGKQGLIPFFFARDLPLYYDSDSSINTIRKGNTIWPKYTEEVMIDQNVASEGINVNRFAVSRTIGDVLIDPPSDHWTVRKQVDESYNPESKEPFFDTTKSVSSAGDHTKAEG